MKCDLLSPTGVDNAHPGLCDKLCSSYSLEIRSME